MLHITGAGRKFEIATKRFTSPQHAKQRKPKHQHKGNTNDTRSTHDSCYYIRSSSSSMTSAQVVTDGKEPTATPRLVAISCRRPRNRWRADSSFGPEARRFLLHCVISSSDGLRPLVFTQLSSSSSVPPAKTCHSNAFGSIPRKSIRYLSNPTVI